MTGKTMVALACNQTNPSNIAVANGVVYWTNYAASGSGGAIMSAPTSGATAPKVVVPGQSYPWAIATDGTNVYWTNYDGPQADAATPSGMSSQTMGTVMQATVTGGNVITLDSGLTTPYGIAVDGTNVYYTAGLANMMGSGFVRKVPIGGSSTMVTVLASTDTQGPTYITVTGEPGSGGEVYWSNYVGGTIRKIATNLTAPGTPTLVACAPSGGEIGPLGLAVDSAGANVYYSDNYGQNVYRVPTTPSGACGPGVVVANLTSGALNASPWGIAVDSTNVYFAADNFGAGTGFLDSVPVAGGAIVNLTPGGTGGNTIQDPTGVAVDATGVYVAGVGTTAGMADGHIWRVSPP